MFQFTPPRKGRRLKIQFISTSYLFQFTPPRKGRPRCRNMPQERMSFNSRPHARGDLWLFTSKMRCRVSIHAPTQGATIDPVNWRLKSMFQFTPPRKGRPYGRRALLADSTGFNSRPHARGDMLTGQRWADMVVSIHAPTQGATLKLWCTFSLLEFQFTPPRKGRRACARNHWKACCWFQFTPPRKGRQFILV